MSLSARILLGFVLLALAGFQFLFDPILDRVERQYLEAAEEPMVDAAELLAGIVAKEMEAGRRVPKTIREGLIAAGARNLDARIYGMAKRKVLMGVYITDDRGIIVFDSEHPERVGVDYSFFNDVGRTLTGGYGARSTRSDPDDDLSSVMYVGAPIIVNGRVAGVVSVYKPQGAMREFIMETRRQILTIGLAAVAVFLLVGLILSRWVTEPLARLTRHAEAVARGERAPVPKMPGRQLTVLARSVERMRDALEDRNYVASYVQTLSHEMKAPVAAIRGAAELLEEDLPAVNRERFLTNIRTEAARLQNLIEQLLALSSLESRRRLEDPQRVDLGEVARRVAAELSSRGGRVDCRAENGCFVRGDEFLLETAVRNFAQNALDFSPPGGRVEISVAREGEEVTVRVTDEGSGIPDYAQERVFERFYSLPRPGTDRKSSGLGLCFVREAADLHGGSASLANRSPGPGAVAILRLPQDAD